MESSNIYTFNDSCPWDHSSAVGDFLITSHERLIKGGAVEHKIKGIYKRDCGCLMLRTAGVSSRSGIMVRKDHHHVVHSGFSEKAKSSMLLGEVFSKKITT